MDLFGRKKRKEEQEARRKAEEGAQNVKSVRRQGRWVTRNPKRLGEKDPDRQSRYNEDDRGQGKEGK